jgi:ribose transport system permease protein
LAIVAAGQTVVIQQRGLDMSAIGMVSIGGLLIGQWGNSTNSLAIGLLVAICAAVAVGVFNGILTSKLHITPLIATLATNAILIGGGRQISGATPISVAKSLQDFSHAVFLGLPLTVWLAVAFVGCIYVFTKKTIMGRRFVAVGVNPATAVAAGIVATRYQTLAYIISAVCFSVAGILLAGYIGNATDTAGKDYLMPAIAAVVVGGTPFTGGRGSVIASGVAALFMAQLSQMVLALGASSAVQLIVQAMALLIATSLQLLPKLLSKNK